MYRATDEKNLEDMRENTLKYNTEDNHNNVLRYKIKWGII